MAQEAGTSTPWAWVSNMGISKRLWLAFGLLLVLLVAQVGAGMLSVRNLNASVDSVLASSELAVFTKDLEVRLANQRLQGREYLFTGDPRVLDRQRALRAEFEQVVAARKAVIEASGHTARFAELSRLHTAYHEMFESVRVLRERYDATIRQRMDPLGEAITDTLATVVESAAAAGEKDLALAAEEAEKHWVLTRFHATRHLAQKDAAAPALMEEHLTRMLEGVRRVSALLNDPALIHLLREVEEHAPDYRTAFKDTVTLDQDIDRERNEVVAKVVGRLYETLAGIIAAVHADQQAMEREAEEEVSNSLLLAAVIGALSLLLGALAARGIAASITGPVNGIRKVMTDLTDGHLDVTVPHTAARDELGEMARAVAAFKDEAVTAARSRIALDRVSAGVMMADADGVITYCNTSITALFTTAEADLRAAAPSFDAGSLIGRNFDIFHKDPAHQRRIVSGLAGPHRSTIKAGRRSFEVTANPVIGRHGERLGTVIEWRDLTDELATEAEIAGIVESAVRGDFTRRVSLEGKAGFFRLVGDGINQLAENVSGVTEELASMLGSLSRGDLSRRIDRSYEGVFQRLKDDFNSTADTLSDIVRRINGAAEAIALSSREVADGSLDLSERTEQQASSLEETAASMEQLAATVRSNADNAQRVNSFADSARAAAERGGQVAADAVEAMRGIERSSQKISDIIGVIDEIAFQTNLLALNAAVEAARAGDAGRGFAVVAQEVRNLAQRSAQASKEIKTLISDSGAQVKDGVDLVRSAGATLTDIVSGIARVADLVSEIARATSEQASGLDEVNSAIAQMDDMTQKNAALVEESTAAARSLEEQADGLRRQMTFFALDRAAAEARAMAGDRAA